MDKIEKILSKIQKVVKNITNEDLKKEIQNYKENFANLDIKIMFPKELKVNASEKYTLKHKDCYKVVEKNSECDFVEEEIWKILKAV